MYWKLREFIRDDLPYCSRKVLQWFYGVYVCDKDILYAFYDLQVSPVTYDAIKFMLLAEDYRKQNTTCKYIHVVIVPGPQEGFRCDGAPYETEDKQWRLSNIVMPIWRLVPACQGITVTASREEARSLQVRLGGFCFPHRYLVDAPRERYLLKHAEACGKRLPSLKVSETARKYVNQWIKTHVGDKRIVTVTLRECGYQEARNSLVNEWAAFIQRLDKKQYCPVIVRDTGCAMFELPSCFKECCVCQPSSWNIEIRAALYEASFINLFVNDGPGGLCTFNHACAGLRFKMLVPDTASSSEHYFRNMGVVPGEQLTCAAPKTRVVWEDDNAETIMRHFKMLEEELKE